MSSYDNGMTKGAYKFLVGVKMNELYDEVKKIFIQNYDNPYVYKMVLRAIQQCDDEMADMG